MDDDGKQSGGSRKAPFPSHITFQEWARILGHSDATLATSTSQEHNRASNDSTSDEMAVGRKRSSWISDRKDSTSAPGMPPNVASMRRASSHDVAGNSFISHAGFNDLSGHEEFGLPLPSHVNPRTLGATPPGKYFFGNQASNDNLDAMRMISRSSSGRERVDREVIVTSEDEDGSLRYPAPLGHVRRASLYERALSLGTMGGDERHQERVDGNSEPRLFCAEGFEVDSGGAQRDGGQQDRPTSREAGNYNTVLRDWLMHVLEKDDQHDTKEVQNLWAAARRQRRLTHKTFEAADYEMYDSKVWHTHKRDTLERMRQGTKGTKELRRQRKHVARILTVVLGAVVGLAGCFVTYFTELIVEKKLHLIAHILEHLEGESDLRRYGTAFGYWWVMNMVLAGGAISMVLYNPWSAGSGIPETKCVLNGVSIPQVLSPRTLVCKLVGIILGVASGLPIGKEGPMIHAGAAIGGCIASLPWIKYLADFRNDRNRRDFAAIGTAAGVAAAFRTPIGGVLFTIEEGASFWSTLLTWRSFAAAVVAVVVYYLVFQGRHMFERPLLASDVFVFGQFRDEDSSFFMWELGVFAIIASLGGLLGALFVACNKRFALFRARHLSGPRRRFVELMMVSTLVSATSFFLPLVLGECRELPPQDLRQHWSSAGEQSIRRLVTFNCHPGYYNELGSLFLNEQDSVIKLLFHFGAPGLRPAAVLTFGVVFLSLECLTIGTWVSSGLFIPSILAGAAMGRGIGELMHRNSRAYALIGSAGLLGGIARMTLSLTVMMVETSGWVLFVIPLMLVFIIARSVGNRFNDGIYDTQIRIKKMPFLEQEPPEETRALNMRANELMTKEVVCLRPIEKVAAVMSALRDYDHNCFPVVEDREQRVLLGTVYRPAEASPMLTWEELEGSYPHYPKIHELKVTEEDMDSLMDIAAYVQIGPHTINEHASAHRAYILFRTLGLRHLVVVNHYNEVMGMITRENLLPEHFKRVGLGVGAYRTYGSYRNEDLGSTKTKERFNVVDPERRGT